MRHVHSDRLERWLGAAEVAQLSASMLGWYGPPIAVANVPGRVYAVRGGEFVGTLNGGRFASYADLAAEKSARIWRRWREMQYGKLNTGFSSLADLVTAVLTKNQRIHFNKTTVTNVTGAAFSAWAQGNYPPAGGNPAAAPGGTAHVGTDTGALPLRNANVSGETMHFIRGELSYTIAAAGQHVRLIYDRIFAVLKTMSSTSTEAVTGVPTRYQSTTQGAQDSAEGNFLFTETIASLGATAHNWTVCQYTDQAGNTGISLPSFAGISSCAQRRLDQPLNTWFAPLAADDTGIKNLTQMQCSASVTGTLAFVMGHPIAWLVTPGFAGVVDGVLSTFNLARVFADACLALLEVNISQSGADIGGCADFAPS